MTGYISRGRRFVPVLLLMHCYLDPSPMPLDPPSTPCTTPPRHPGYLTPKLLFQTATECGDIQIYQVDTAKDTYNRAGARDLHAPSCAGSGLQMLHRVPDPRVKTSDTTSNRSPAAGWRRNPSNNLRLHKYLSPPQSKACVYIAHKINQTVPKGGAFSLGKPFVGKTKRRLPSFTSSHHKKGLSVTQVASRVRT